MSKGCLSYWVIVCVYKEGRTPKNSCLETVVLEKTSESPLDSKEIKPVNPKRVTYVPDNSTVLKSFPSLLPKREVH